MSQHSFKIEEHERREDLPKVRAALEADQLLGKDIRDRGAILAEDIAEGTGLPQDEVIRHLDRIRTERAWRMPTHSMEKLLIGAGTIALAAGLYSAWTRSHTETPLLHNGLPPVVVSLGPTPPTPQVTTTVTRPNITFQSSVMQQDPSVPAGINLHIVAKGQYIQSQGSFTGRPPKAMPFAVDRDMLAKAVQNLIQDVETPDLAPTLDSQTGLRRHIRFPTQPSKPVGETVRDYAGATFTIQANKAHVTLEGWPGTSEFWVDEPLSANSAASIKESVGKYLSDLKAKQDEALRTSLDPTRGLVSPPPGMRIQFAGRRLDIQEGPRLAFADVTVDQMAKRIELAIHNAFERDHRPPTGRWTTSAEVDRKTPIPSMSSVVFTRGDDSMTFDLPTSSQWTSRDSRIISEKATEWATKIVNNLADNGQPPTAPR